MVLVASSEDKLPILDKTIESCASLFDSSIVLPCFIHSVAEVATSTPVTFNCLPMSE